MNEQAEQREAPAQRPAEPVMHVSISGGGQLFLWLSIILGLVLGMPIANATILPKLPETTPRFVQGAIAGATVLPIIVLGYYFLSKRTEREIRWLSDVGREFTDVALAARLGNKLTKLPHKRTYRFVLQALHSNGFAGRTLFFSNAQQPERRPQAIDVAFDPTPLDETDAAFDELESGLHHQDQVENATGITEPKARERLFRRRVKRNLIITGMGTSSVFGVIGLLIGLLMMIVGTIAMWRIDFDAILIIAFVSSAIGGAWYRGWFSGPIWLLVTGGLVFRKPRRRTARSDVHVFCREQSVLVFRSVRKHLWTMAVWDGKEFGLGQVSEDEVNLLLRAWLSPLAPPAVEKLVDLT